MFKVVWADFRCKQNMSSQANAKRLLRSSTTGTPTQANKTTVISSGPGSDGNETEGNDAAKCNVCLEIFISNNDKLVICDRCENWICLKCTGLSEAQYLALDGNLQWYCTECKVPAIQAVKVDCSIEEKCKEYLDSFRIEFKAEIDNQLREIREDIQDIKMKQNQTETSGEDVDVKVKKVIQESMQIQEQELQDREKRKNNIIMFNVVEADTNIKDERVRHDTNILRRIIETICDNEVDESAISEI